MIIWSIYEFPIWEAKWRITLTGQQHTSVSDLTIPRFPFWKYEWNMSDQPYSNVRRAVRSSDIIRYECCSCTASLHGRLFINNTLQSTKTTACNWQYQLLVSKYFYRISTSKSNKQFLLGISPPIHSIYMGFSRTWADTFETAKYKARHTQDSYCQLGCLLDYCR